MKKQKILIVDDSEMNRILLTDILEEQYDITEAENGLQAVEILGENETDFWFVLLDIMMPEMDGFEVLNYINTHYWNERVVVMMISSDDSPANINRAYSLGAFDYISRPFDTTIVRQRIANTLLLYARQHDLENAVKEQFYEQQRNNDLMISILSHIVEFRNGESGMHIQHVKVITELLLKQLVRLTDQYSLTDVDITLISMTSALHDIGKISIPEEILNKPGRLTEEEFEVMKTHSEIGAKMLEDLPGEKRNSALVKIAREICRWHHERYDGKGYPDGLKGKEIPIAAQVVAVADVYDALTSERCYKKAYSHETAISMILKGKCGIFNPLLLQCLEEISDRLKKECARIDSEQEPEKSQFVKVTASDTETTGKEEQDGPLDQLGYMQLLYVDSVTKIYNRRYYEEHIRNAFRIEAAALVDIDKLKPINDMYGYDTGDLVLKNVAQILLQQIQKSDHLFRYGSDEFLILFGSVTKSEFEERLEKIRASFETLTVDGFRKLRLAVNIGGVYGKGNSEAFFGAANRMLVQARSAKKQVMICYFDEQESCAAMLEQEET